MKELVITIPERLVERLTEIGREPSEAIIEALNKYLDPSYHQLDLQRWQQHMEKKVQDLQHQLDAHISNSSSDVGKDFDKDLWGRRSGSQSPMALDKPPATQPIAPAPRSIVNEVSRTKTPVEQVEVDLFL